MTVETITGYFASYGGIAIFVIVLLEYMNLPGFPAGVIMPLAGIWAARGNINFYLALLITIAAGLTGSLILYFLGYKGGEIFLEKYLNKYPKQRPAIESKLEWVRRKGSIGIFISKLIPMLRTLISIPAGVSKMNLFKYTVSSALGIFVWNLAFVGAGYFFGDAILG
ncbi:MAG: DedA family protein [Suilimivivens sp.]